MKNYIIIKYFILCAIFILNSGCDNYLNVIPESEYSLEGAYKNDKDFEMAIAGVYSRLYQIHQTNILTNSLRSDDVMMMPYVLHAQYQDISRFRETETNPVLLSIWRGYWKIINQCNVILGKIDLIEFRDPDMKNYIKGEAHLVRGFSYYSLAYLFGGIPIISKETAVTEIYEISRSTQDETMDFAKSDFEKSINLLPNNWETKYEGRATVYAAKGMLSKLLLFQKKFDLAEPLLKDIISSGKYSMEKEYVDCFKDSKDNGPERVWEAQFIGGQTGLGQSFSSSWYGEAFSDPEIIPVPGSNPYPIVTDDIFYTAYEAGDLRKNLSILKGWGKTLGREDDTTTLFCIKYIHHDYIPVTKSDWSNNLPIIRYTDIKMMYAEALNEKSYIQNGVAFDILNEVRKRAGLHNLSALDLPNKDAFRKAIRNERRVEFAFEGTRWIDIIRWGVVNEVMNSFFMKTSYEDGSIRYKMEDHQKLFPIPFLELSNYNNESIMWQNPGY